MLLPLIAFAVLLVQSTVQAYTYPCLDECQCDTDDEAIHCHNGQRTTLFMPEKRLRGFTVVGMTGNAVVHLPSETDILDKLPDVKAIDVEGNPNFDCESLKNFRHIKVYSGCEGQEDLAVIVHGERLPDIEKPTDSCNFECQVKKHYHTLHEYLLRIWKMLKIKYDDMDKETVVKDVRDFFVKLAAKVNKNLDEVLSEVQLRLKSSDSTRPQTRLPFSIFVDSTEAPSEK